METSKVILELPNGGYGWIVVFGGILINMINIAIFSVFGLLFGPFFDSIKVEQSDIALVMNLTSFFGSITAILTGATLKYFTVRQVSVTACLLTSIGLTLSAFTVSAYQTILTFSVLAGFGFGYLANTTVIAVSSYFTTKKKRAVSFALAGSGIGQIILPQIVKYLETNYTAKESVMIMGSLLLIGVIGALLFQPVENHLKPGIMDETKPLISTSVPPIICDDNSSIWKKLTDTMDLELLKDSRFLILNFVLGSGYAVAIDFTLILPFFLQESAKLDKSQTAMCLSVLATFELISRLTFHFITDRTCLSSRQILVIGIICLGIIKTTLTFLTTYQSILFVCSIYGYFRAIVIVNQILTISEHCSKYYPKRFASALGLNLAFSGISVLIFGQFFGMFRNYFNDFSYSFYLEDVFVIFILSIWFIEYLYNYKK